MIHECKQIEETVNRLHKDLRKRLSEVETRLSSQNRSDLFSGGSADSNSRAAVEGKEAAIRLRKVNDDVGRIIKGGQVRLFYTLRYLKLFQYEFYFFLGSARASG